MSNKGAFVVLSHSHFPIQRGENKGKIQTTESCQFLDRIKKRHLSTSTVIIDVHKRDFVVNRYRQEGLTYDQIEEHIIKGYADKYKRFLEIVEADIPEALTLTKEEVEAEVEKLVVEDENKEEE